MPGDEDVHHLPAGCKLPVDAYRRDAEVSGGGQLRGRLLRIQLLALLHANGPARQVARGRHGGQERPQGGDHEEVLTACHPRERGDPLPEQGGKGACPLVANRAPPGEKHGARGAEGLHVLHDGLRLQFRRDHDDGGAAFGPPVQAVNDKGQVGALGAVNAKDVPVPPLRLDKGAEGLGALKMQVQFFSKQVCH